LVRVAGIGMFGIGIREERKVEVGIFGNLLLDFFWDIMVVSFGNEIHTIIARTGYIWHKGLLDYLL
jgi:hypothetical protein